MPHSASDLTHALDRLDALQAELDALRPLTDEQAGRAMQRLRLEWTYHSNAIEGNSLTYGETRALLMHGVTAQGKPLKDHLDIRRHGEAIEYIESFIRSEDPVRVDLIKEIHLRLMGDEYEIIAETPNGDRVKRTVEGGVYKEHPNNVKTGTGEIHYYASPLEVPGRMAELVEWLDSVEARAAHPVVRAALFHHRFVEIHPFPDGNGRVSRMLMNVLLMRDGYVPAVIRQENRPAYYGALAAADGEETDPIVAFVADELAETMELYVRAVKGEPDPTGLSRRISLLKIRTERLPSTPSDGMRQKAAWGSQFIIPLRARFAEVVSELKPLFLDAKGWSLVVSQSSQQVHGSKADELLTSGSWRSFEMVSNLADINGAPGTAIQMAISGHIDETGLRLSTKPDGQEITLSEIQDSLEASALVEQVAQAVLSLVESELNQRTA